MFHQNSLQKSRYLEKFNFKKFNPSQYYYDRHERAITRPGTAEHRAKHEYIEKLIGENIPTDPLKAAEKFGITRCEWVIDFYKMATNAQQRGEDNPRQKGLLILNPLVKLNLVETSLLIPDNRFISVLFCRQVLLKSVNCLKY